MLRWLVVALMAVIALPAQAAPVTLKMEILRGESPLSKPTIRTQSGTEAAVQVGEAPEDFLRVVVLPTLEANGCIRLELEFVYHREGQDFRQRLTAVVPAGEPTLLEFQAQGQEATRLSVVARGD